jgi:hypothetical protein
LQVDIKSINKNDSAVVIKLAPITAAVFEMSGSKKA